MQILPRQRGVSLIEVMVAVLIFSIGLIGLAGLMVMSTRSNHAAYLRTQVIFLANTMADRMSANPSAVWSGAYNSTSYPVSASTAANNDCSSACNTSALASADQREWSSQLKIFLPNPQATIACTGVTGAGYNPSSQINFRPPYGGDCKMTIQWNERGAGDKTHSDSTPQVFAWEFQP